MIFGLKEKKAALGQFTSEKCTSCKKSNKYMFYRITKYIVIFFISLIPVANRYECECVNCDDNVKVDKKAGKKLAKQKFSVENGNQNFIITVKLILASIFLAAAIVLPIVLIGPAVSPQTLKSLITEDGAYTIVNKEDQLLGSVTSVDGQLTLERYNDISDYKSPNGDKFTLYKYYEEVKTEEGSYMSPIADDFGALVDFNNVKVQNYYYDIANDTYGFAIGVKDLSLIEYTDGKAVYPITYQVSDTVAYNTLRVVYTEEDWKIVVRLQVLDNGTEELMDITLSRLEDGRVTTETNYMPSAQDGSILYLGNLSSKSTAQEYYDFLLTNSLSIDYTKSYTYYEDTDIITGIVTTSYDAAGTPTSTEENYSVTKKYNYYILSIKE